MRRIPLLLATLVTFTYMTAAQVAIASDLTTTTVRALRKVALEEPGKVWNGGTLAPITVEATVTPKTPAAAPARSARPAVPTT